MFLEKKEKSFGGFFNDDDKNENDGGVIDSAFRRLKMNSELWRN